MDCEHNLHQKVKVMPKIEIDIDLTQVMGDTIYQFSYEDQGSLGLHTFLLFIYSAIFGLTIWSYYNFNKVNDRYDSPHFVMLLALFCHMSGIFFEVLHLWMYSYNGKGIPVFDIFYLIGTIMSEIILSILLMMMAHGWTIVYQDLDFDNNVEFYLPVGAITVAIHMVLAAMTYVDVDAHHKFHDYAGL